MVRVSRWTYQSPAFSCCQTEFVSIYTYFTHIAASSSVIGDVTHYATHGILGHSKHRKFGGMAQWLERRPLTGKLTLIYAWSMVDMWPIRG